MLRATQTSTTVPLVPGETSLLHSNPLGRWEAPGTQQTGSDPAQFTKGGTRGECREFRAEAQHLSVRQHVCSNTQKHKAQHSNPCLAAAFPALCTNRRRTM